MTIEYLGWLTYTNTGAPYRRWKFLEACEELDASEGDCLEDRGPSRGPDTRFWIRRDRGKSNVADLETVQEVLFQDGAALPPWKAPRELGESERRSLGLIATALQDIDQAIRRHTTHLMAQASERTREKGKLQEPEGEDSSPYLRLKGKYEYDNGDPYTDFELLVDCPEIPVTRVKGLDPMHAAKGDVLRETQDDELTPFELRRDGKRIGDPEWWQVRHLFENAPEGMEHGAAGAVPGPLQLLRRLIPEGLAKHPGGGGGGVSGYVFYAVREVPSAGIRKGDLLLWNKPSGRALLKRELAELRGSVSQVPRAAFQPLSEAVPEGVLSALDTSWPRAGGLETELMEYLAKPRVQAAKDESSPLYILRPLVDQVSAPIHASTDEAAIFELLHQVGGKMPATEED